MNLNSEKIIPSRRPSGRLSKPSMELLVDNQRLLSHYMEPKKKHKVQIKKFTEEIGSQSNYSEKSSVSSTDKYKTKTRRSAPVAFKTTIKPEKSPIKDITESKTDSVKKTENKLDISNGDNHMDNDIKNVTNENNFLDRTPYVTIELNDIVLKSVKSAQNSPKSLEVGAVKSPDKSDKPFETLNKSPIKSDKSPENLEKIPEELVKSPEKLTKSPEKAMKSPNRQIKSPEKQAKSPEKISISQIIIEEPIDNKSDDDLPLSKVYPDFKPPGERPRDTSTLPPKKKIKFIDINELNGSANSSFTIKDSPMKVPKLKLVFGSLKSSLSGMSKISKKIATTPHVNGPNVVEVLRDSPTHGPIEVSPVSDSNDVLSTSTASPTRPIDSCTHHTDATKRCIRQSCTNIAIEDFQWDKEFCSPDCAIIHSKFLFNEWLNQRRDLSLLSE